MICNDPQLTIISNGNPYETQILDSNGNMLRNVSKVTYEIEGGGWGVVKLEFVSMPIDVKIATDRVPMIKMRKWFKTIIVHPAFVGHFYSKGYKIIKSGINL